MLEQWVSTFLALKMKQSPFVTPHHRLWPNAAFLSGWWVEMGKVPMLAICEHSHHQDGCMTLELLVVRIKIL